MFKLTFNEYLLIAKITFSAKSSISYDDRSRIVPKMDIQKYNKHQITIRRFQHRIQIHYCKLIGKFLKVNHSVVSLIFYLLKCSQTQLFGNNQSNLTKIGWLTYQTYLFLKMNCHELSSSLRTMHLMISERMLILRLHGFPFLLILIKVKSI